MPVMQEYCLQSLEFFVLAAPQDAKALFDAIFSTALSALAYDPNYTEAMEDDDSDQDAEEDECALFQDCIGACSKCQWRSLP